MQRLGDEAYRRWDPEVMRVILDEMASSSKLTDAIQCLLSFLHRHMDSQHQFSAARSYCLRALAKQSGPLQDNQAKLSELPGRIRSLLRHQLIQLPLAAEEVALLVQRQKSPEALEKQLSLSLVEAVGSIVRRDAKLSTKLEKILESQRLSKSHAMTASILFAADPSWRPSGQRSGVDFSGGYFSKAMWDGVSLVGLTLQLAEFNEAQLVGACFDEAVVVETDFVGANLQESWFNKSLAVGADFDRADLRSGKFHQAKLERASFVKADLRKSDLWKANLCGANLSGANCDETNFTYAMLIGTKLHQASFQRANLSKIDARRVDFRTVELAGARLSLAWLNGANFEDVLWDRAMFRKAKLRGALLTGSRFRNADFTEADLSESCLSEIDWEYADLRDANLTNATFHMGSSRSGLVDSYFASEGTRTGFYTDDLEELYFKKPEAVRKANLRGADLRGADITGVDFYLVDLRGAKLDPFQLHHARQTGAILSE